MHVVGAPEAEFAPPSLPPEPPLPPDPPLPPGELSDPQPASRIDRATPMTLRPSPARFGIELPSPFRGTFGRMAQNSPFPIVDEVRRRLKLSLRLHVGSAH